MNNSITLMALILLSILVVFQGLLLFKFTNQIKFFAGVIATSSYVKFRKELQIGQAAPPFKLKDQFKQELRVGPNSNSNTLLIFISSGCPTCKRFVDSISSTYNFEYIKIFFISNKELDDSYISKFKNHNLSFSVSPDIFQLYNIRSAPQAIIVNSRGYITDTLKLQTWEDLAKQKIGW